MDESDPRTAFHATDVVITTTDLEAIWRVQMLCACAMVIMARLKRNPQALVVDEDLKHVYAVALARTAAMAGERVARGEDPFGDVTGGGGTLIAETGEMVKMIGAQSGEAIIAYFERLAKAPRGDA